MRARVFIGLVLLSALAGPAYGIVDLSAGPYFGMTVPIVNDDAKRGSMFGLQARVSVLSFLAVGAHFQSGSFGNPEETFFAGTPGEVTLEKDGGDLTTFAADVFLGGSGGTPGISFYMVGSIGTYKWKRDNVDEVSEISYAVGPGLEMVLPFGLGIEGRAMFEVVPKGDDGSFKNFLWFIGANYHFGTLTK
jgi:hypothetical protein